MILDNCDIGRRAKIRRAILDKNVRIPEGATIGYDLDQDRKYHTVTDNGIVVVEGLPLLRRHLVPADLVHSEGGFAPLPTPPPRKDCAGEPTLERRSFWRAGASGPGTTRLA